jgi:DNA-binding MarR family transcriptional regulator
MGPTNSSRRFTKPAPDQETFGPPLIGALLRMSLQVVHARMLERLHEHGFTDLDAAHLTVFQYPGPQGTKPTELAARLRISKQALNYLLGHLEHRGYLEREPDPDDQRSKRITLTQRGTAIIPLIRDAVAEVEHEWRTTLGPNRFTQLRDALHDLNRLIDRH